MGTIHVVGGGLAGSEAAWQALKSGKKVCLYEMRPEKKTEAHQTGRLAELVCSNSLKSLTDGSATARLKAEMQALDSIIVNSAFEARVPAGQALAVDRELFSKAIETSLDAHPNFTKKSIEVIKVPTQSDLEAVGDCYIICTGPLSSAAITEELQRLSGGKDRLFFYDAIAPVLDADSLDMDKIFRADRYGEEEGIGDYLNIPLNKDQYETFVDAVVAAEKAPLHDFENTKYFESCLPIEVMIERGRDTPRFGPMKPVGLTDPKTGRYPYAAVQLRQENNYGTMYSMVGFQTKMKWGAQKEVFKMLPGLENVEFHRMGSVHRNTYLQSPDCLSPDLNFLESPRVFLAGQITGVEGYTESAAIGLLAGRAAGAMLQGKTFVMPPKETMLGALHDYVTMGCKGPFAPMNANLGLLPTIQKKRGISKKDRKLQQCQNAKNTFESYFAEQGFEQ